MLRKFNELNDCYLKLKTDHDLRTEQLADKQVGDRAPVMLHSF